MKKLITILFIFLCITTFAQEAPEMVFVKGGSFSMGNANSDKTKKGDDDERPVHKVKLNDFYIGKFEVTVKQFKEFLSDGSYTEFDKFGVLKSLPSSPDSIWWQGHPDSKKYWDAQMEKWWGWKPNFPMFNVTWFDAVAYCNWLSQKNGLEKCYYLNKDGGISLDIKKNGYRLPTEAEWEYAARGGNKQVASTFSGSNNFNDVAWVDDNTLLSGPKAVGTKTANELGIHDMSGNVWEWCSDYYSPGFYAVSPETNPINERITPYRVVRGGGWHYSVNYASVTTRDGPKSGFTDYTYGFRIARNK